MATSSLARLGLCLVWFLVTILLCDAFSISSGPIHKHALLTRTHSRTCSVSVGLPSSSLNGRDFHARSTALRLGGDGTVKKAEEEEDEDDEEQDDEDVPFEVRMDALRRMQSFKLEIDVIEASKKLRRSKDEGEKKIFLLDVREQGEYDFCKLAQSVLIPMSEMRGRYDEVPKDKEVLVYCHHGQRSMQVVRYLRTRGWKRVTNIQGGIEEWSRLVDPSIPTY